MVGLSEGITVGALEGLVVLTTVDGEHGLLGGQVGDNEGLSVCPGSGSGFGFGLGLGLVFG
jgi:hypothetical protein